jgi:hypothetical protein
MCGGLENRRTMFCGPDGYETALLPPRQAPQGEQLKLMRSSPAVAWGMLPTTGASTRATSARNLAAQVQDGGRSDGRHLQQQRPDASASAARS